MKYATYMTDFIELTLLAIICWLGLIRWCSFIIKGYLIHVMLISWTDLRIALHAQLNLKVGMSYYYNYTRHFKVTWIKLLECDAYVL